MARASADADIDNAAPISSPRFVPGDEHTAEILTLISVVGHRHRRGQHTACKVSPAVAPQLLPRKPAPHHYGAYTLRISSIAPNVRFRVPLDFESPLWPFGADTFDFVHLRMACGGVTQWPELYHQIFTYVFPGSFLRSEPLLRDQEAVMLLPPLTSGPHHLTVLARLEAT